MLLTALFLLCCCASSSLAAEEAAAATTEPEALDVIVAVAPAAVASALNDDMHNVFMVQSGPPVDEITAPTTIWLPSSPTSYRKSTANVLLSSPSVVGDQVFIDATRRYFASSSTEKIAALAAALEEEQDDETDTLQRVLLDQQLSSSSLLLCRRHFLALLVILFLCALCVPDRLKKKRKNRSARSANSTMALLPTPCPVVSPLSPEQLTAALLSPTHW